MKPNLQLDTGGLKPRIKLSLRMGSERVNTIISQLAKTYSSVNDVAPVDHRELMPVNKGAKYTHKEGTMAPMAFHLGVNSNSYWFTALVESIEIQNIHRVTTAVKLSLTGIKGVGVVRGGCHKNRRCPAPEAVGDLETEYVWTGDLTEGRTTYDVLRKLQKRGVEFVPDESESKPIGGLAKNLKGGFGTTLRQPFLGEIGVEVTPPCNMHPPQGNIRFAQLQVKPTGNYMIYLGQPKLDLNEKVPVVVNLDELSGLAADANRDRAKVIEIQSDMKWLQQIEQGTYSINGASLIVANLGSQLTGTLQTLGQQAETLVSHLIIQLRDAENENKRLSDLLKNINSLTEGK